MTRFLVPLVVAFLWLSMAQVAVAGEPENQATDKQIAKDQPGDALPQGAVIRLGTQRLRHGGLVNTLDYSPDGKSLVAAGGYDGIVRIWDVATGKEVRHMAGEKGKIDGVSFSPDGKMIASANSWQKTVCLWDAVTGKELRQLTGHGKSVFSLCFASTGETIATSSFDETVRLWNVATGTERFQIKGGKGVLQHVSFADQGKTLITIGTNKVKFLDAATGKERRQVEAKEGGFLLIPGKNILISCDQAHVVHLWDLEKGKELQALKGHRGPVLCAAYSPDGTLLATAGGHEDHTLRVWEVNTGKMLWKKENLFYAQLVSFSPDGKTLVSGGGAICFWDALTGKEINPRNGHRGPVNRIAFAPDGKTIASASSDQTVRLWDIATGKQRHCLKGHELYVEALDFAPDGKTLASGSWDQTLRIWDADTGKVQHVCKDISTVWCVTYSSDSKLIAGGASDRISLWDVKTGKEVHRLAKAHQGRVWSVAFSLDGFLFASAGEDHMIRVWDVASWKQRLQFEGHKGDVRSVAFSADGKFLVSAGGNGTPDTGFCLWDVDTGKELQRSRLLFLKQVVISSDGRTIAGGGKTPGLWEKLTSTQALLANGHREEVQSVAFSPDGTMLGTAGEDTTVLLWNVSLKSCPINIPKDDLESLWAGLGNKDASQAYPAMCGLARRPKDAVPFIERALTSPTDATKVARLIGDLDANKVSVREKASEELEGLGKQAETALRTTLANKPSAEVERRIKSLLKQLEDPNPSPQVLRACRAITVLENIQSAEATTVLEAFSKGAAKDPITQEAKTALERLQRKSP